VIRVAELSLPALLVVAAAVAVVHAVDAVGFDWNLYPTEDQNAYFADRLANHGELYRDWGDAELLFPIYAPLYYVAVAPLSWIAGPELWGARLVSLLSAAIAAVLAGLTARRLGANRLESVASALAFVTVPFGAIAIVAARPDAPALAFTAAALFAATLWEDTRSNRSLVGAGVASVALLFTRQNYAPIVLAIAIGVLLRDRRAGSRFVLSVLGASLTLVGVTNLLTDGAFLSNSRDFSAIGYSLEALGDVVDAVTLPFPNPILAVGAIEAIVALLAWRTARSVAWAWLGGLLVLLTAVWTGSSVNYALALGLTSSILLGPALARARQAAGPRIAAAAAGAIALLLLPHTVSVVQELPRRIDELGHLDRVYSRSVEQIEAIPGETVGDRLDLMLASGNPPGPDLFNHTKFAEAGVWNPDPLAQRIRRRELAAIQTSVDVNVAEPWAPPLIAAIRDYYCPIFAEYVNYPVGIYVYVPCPEPRSPRAAQRQ
jgi:hypothetical protein